MFKGRRGNGVYGSTRKYVQRGKGEKEEDEVLVVVVVERERENLKEK